ncbi:MAG: adenosine kinase [Gammaproteobacteria bacterium]|nr:adenosine kinase [Gammaproteobacteria bacterium]NNM20648.1 adenosine kinase [Gammaproteobacteria bacterium]
MSDSVELLGLSNAIVDILAHVEDDFLEEIGAQRGSMTLIDADQARQLYQRMGPATEMSGGSVGNTIAGFANLGGEAAYIGRVAADQLGAIFAHDMKSLGVDMRLPPETRMSPTARSHVLISPDGQRTMQTYLGACGEIAPEDINEKTIGQPDILLIEGYIWDTPNGPEITQKAMEIANQSGAMIGLSLSDDQCVLRHRDEFTRAVKDYVRLIFADEDEIIALLQADNFDAAVAEVKGSDALYVITRSEKGSVILHGDHHHVQQADKLDEIVDTTGAGDAYTAGFLYGLAKNWSIAECATLGTRCASAVIGQVGARLEKGVIDINAG